MYAKVTSEDGDAPPKMQVLLIFKDVFLKFLRLFGGMKF